MDRKKFDPTIVDILAGHPSVTPLMNVTADQRLYDNCRLDQPSVDPIQPHSNRSPVS